jgi:hypothetical protein
MKATCKPPQALKVAHDGLPAGARIHLAQQLAGSDLGARAVYGRADEI